MNLLTDRNWGEARRGAGAGVHLPLRAAFSLTLGLGASLLFLVQPMIAKTILPLLGGSPATWVTCMVFFQAVVLVGYLYAHAAARVLAGRRGLAVHVALVVLAALALPLLDLPGRVGRGGGAGTVASLVGLGAPPRTSNPVGWLLGLLAVSVGLPALAVATTSPLLQKWFAGTADPRAGDPYFLYAASNLGSLVALVGYPTVVEPYLRLADQGRLWCAGYVLLTAGIVVCASLVGRSAPAARGQAPAPPLGAEVGLSVLRRLRWVALALVPSGLLLGVTSYLSSDIAAVPMLWVVPLALYLLTLVLAFSRLRLVPERLLVRGLPLLILAQVYSLLFGGERQPIWLLVLLHLSTFFAAAMICHAELARDRPPPRYLTEFYLWMSLGGVLGGLFNALVAPLVFDTVAEYPLEMGLACLLGPRLAPRAAAARRPRRRAGGGWGIALPLIFGLLAVVLLVVVVQTGDLGRGRLGAFVGLGLSLTCYAAALALTDRPLLFGLSVGAFLLVSTVGTDVQGRLLYRGRSFFGVLRVAIDPTGKYVQLFHGRTIHGKQRITPDPRRRLEPLTYYHPDGPIGQVFQTVRGPGAHAGVAVVGLGAGSLASYGKPGQRMDFFEIDPGVEWVARDSGYFTFLRDSAGSIGVVLGDARLSLARAPDAGYGMIVLDAFSSDAIPVHLVTREALRDVYLRKLAPGGLLAFHISNRYIDLRPVLAALARDASLACRARVDPTADDATGKSASTWVVMARDPADLGPLAADPRWVAPEARPGMPVWTDDYSDVLGVIK